MVTRDPTAAVQLKFRVREGLRAKLEAAAKEHGLTLNAEITMRLEQSFELDALKRELEVERAHLRRTSDECFARVAEAHQRTNQLTDYLLQITTANVRVRSPEEKA
jgi:hypothetical protein